MADSLTAETVEVVEWRPDLADATVAMLSRAFARNPIHLAAFGAERVVECNRAFFRAGLSVFRGRRLVAVYGADVVGFVHWADSPGCQLTLGQRAGLVPGMVRGFGVKSTLRVGAWLSAWAKHDAQAPHSHFGPIGVDPDMQGRGVGRRLMEEYCAALDRGARPGCLETDEPENVAFYRLFGFDVVREVEAIGITTFFMARPAACSASQAKAESRRAG